MKMLGVFKWLTVVISTVCLAQAPPDSHLVPRIGSQERYGSMTPFLIAQRTSITVPRSPNFLEIRVR
jgi:hypothetical protein